MKRTWFSLAVFLVVFGASGSGAVETVFWSVESQRAWTKGTSHQVSILKNGRVVLGPRIELLAKLKEPQLWKMERAGKLLYVATGPEGRIYVFSEGKLKRRIDTGAESVISLAWSGKYLYAGTAPDGQLIAYGDEGREVGRWSFEEPYVSAILPRGADMVFVCTGSPGRIHSCSVSGNCTIVCEIGESQVRSLADGGGGRLLVGTWGRGLVLEVDSEGAVRVIMDPEEGEVNNVVLDEGMKLWASAVSTPRASEGSPSGNGEQPASGDAAPGSSLYLLEKTGAWDRIWSSRKEAIAALLADGEAVIMATSGRGARLYRVFPDGRYDVLLKLDESTASCITPADGGWYFGSVAPSSVYLVSSRVAREGYVESSAYDAGNVVRWGRLKWEGKGKVRFLTRSGNTDTPDETWDKWSDAIEEEEAGLRIQSPSSQFIQWRAILSADGSADYPYLDRVAVAYLPPNLPPKLKAIMVYPPGGRVFPSGSESAKQTVVQTLPGNLRVEYSVPGQPEAELPDAEVSWVRGVTTVRWAAYDPNEDRLRYTLFFKSSGEDGWRLLAKDLKEQIYSWSTRSLSDGRYRVKVVASDGKSNPPARALTASMESKSVVIDNSPPRVVQLKAERTRGGSYRIAARLEDDTSPLRRARFSIDGMEWRAVLPVDGVFDSKLEKLDFQVNSELTPGSDVFIEAVDFSGNTSTGRVVVGR